ncbi:MAG: phosphopyruvate hydratase [archaeon]
MAELKIKKILGRQIIDSRGYPTVECDLTLSDGAFGRAAVPSGASTGSAEAIELRDGGAFWGGKGVTRAVANVNGPIAKSLKGKRANQAEVDALLIKLDGTENKSNLGANSTLAVSLALARAIADSKGKELYETLGKERNIPTPMFNVINGGKHAGGKLAIQEFMLIPLKLASFSDKLRAGVEIYQVLKGKLREKYGVSAVNVGDEGGFAPPIETTEEALRILSEAISSAGYSGKVFIGLDSAASTFYRERKYFVDGKTFSREGLVQFYLELSEKFPALISFEDFLEENDFDGFADFLRLAPKGTLVVGDDLFTTNVRRMQIGIDKKSANTLLLKVNQIGTLTEAIEAGKLARKAGWKVVVSHRSGETNDDFISDLAVGFGADFIKAGAPCRGERLAKYNRLLRIEELL